MSFIATITPLYLDMIFSDIKRLPDYGEEVFAKNFDIQLGGGSLVPAIVLNRLKVKSKLGTFLSDDLISNISKDLLIKHNMEWINLYNGNGNPIVVTSVSSFKHDRCFTCYNPREHEKMLSDEEVYDFFKGSKVCFVLEGYENVFKRLKEEGTAIIYDMGWDDDLSIKKIEEILSFTDVFTPNDKEAMKMTNTNNVEDAIKIIAKYVKHPIVKIGKEGCITIDNNEILHVPMPMKFDAVDTTGAGDNFLAGVMYGMYNNWSIVDCMKMGNVLGGYSTTEVGCYKANITYDKAMDILKKY